MTNTEIAAALVKVRRGEKKLWNVYAPGQPGQRKLQAAFTTKKDAEKHAFHIAAHVAALLDAGNRIRLESYKGRKNGDVLADICAKAGQMSAGELHAAIVPLIVSAMKMSDTDAFNAGVEAARVECGAMMRDARQMKQYVVGNALAQLWAQLNGLRRGR